ncbi:hypothetical protein [Kribbella swartbergensis]
MTDFVGTATLVRLALRRDRILIPVWILVFVTMAAGSAQASIELYPDVESRVEAARTSNSSPALVSLYGRIFDETSLGELSLFKLTAFGAALVGLLARSSSYGTPGPRRRPGGSSCSAPESSAGTPL